MKKIEVKVNSQTVTNVEIGKTVGTKTRLKRKGLSDQELAVIRQQTREKELLNLATNYKSLTIRKEVYHEFKRLTKVIGAPPSVVMSYLVDIMKAILDNGTKTGKVSLDTIKKED